MNSLDKSIYINSVMPVTVVVLLALEGIHLHLPDVYLFSDIHLHRKLFLGYYSHSLIILGREEANFLFVCLSQRKK